MAGNDSDPGIVRKVEETPTVPDDRGPSDGAVRIHELNIKCKLFQTYAICGSLVVVAAIIALAAIRMTEAPWVTLGLAALLPTSALSVLLGIALRTRRRYVRKTHRRVVELEKRLHPERTTSTGDPDQGHKALKDTLDG